MATDKKQVEIPGRLHSVATEGVVTGANEILDDNKGKNQQEINASVDDSLQENKTNIANEITRATNAENAIKGGSSKSIQNLDSRLSTVEAHDTISMDGGSVVVGTAEDFTNRTTAGDAKIPTVGAILNGADEEPTAGSDNLVKSGGVQNELALGAVYDVSAKNPTAGPNNDGKFESLSALLSDNNLNTLIPTSVRRGGMSIKFVQSSDNKYVRYNLLADSFTTDTTQWAIDDGGVYIENPEFIKVYTDKDGRIPWAIKADGSIYWGAGVPQQVIDYVTSKISELSLDEYEDIVSFLGSLIDGDKTLQQLLNEKVDKEDGKSLIPSRYIQEIENPEFIEAYIDDDRKLLWAIKKDGSIYYGAGVPKQIVDYISNKTKIDGKEIKDYLNETYGEYVEDTEQRIEIETDNDKKIISYRDKNGVLHENAGIKTPEIKLSQEGLDKLSEELDIPLPETIGLYKSPDLPKHGTTNIKTETFYLTAVSGFNSISQAELVQDVDDTTANASDRMTICHYYFGDTRLRHFAAGKVKLNSSDNKYYAKETIRKVNGVWYYADTLGYNSTNRNKVIDGYTEQYTGDNIPASGNFGTVQTEVIQCSAPANVNTWTVEDWDFNAVDGTDIGNKYEHWCSADIDFGHYLTKEDAAIGVKHQGNSTQSYRKRNFRYTFYKNSAFAKKDKVKIGEMLRLSKFNLKANWGDPTRIKELVLYRIFTAIWQNRPIIDRYNWDNVINGLYHGATGNISGFPIALSVNGNFYGIYMFCLPKDGKNYLIDDKDESTGLLVCGAHNTANDWGVSYPYNITDPLVGHYDSEMDSDFSDYPMIVMALEAWTGFINNRMYKAEDGKGYDLFQCTFRGVDNNYYSYNQVTFDSETGKWYHNDVEIRSIYVSDMYWDAEHNTYHRNETMEVNDIRYVTSTLIYNEQTGEYEVGPDSVSVTHFNLTDELIPFDREHIPYRLDLLGFIDYFICMQLFVMVDSTHNNVMLYSGPKKEKMYPFFYDIDSAIQESRPGGAECDILAEGVSLSNDLSLWKHIKDEYWDDIVNRYCELRKTYLSIDYIRSVYEDIAKNIPTSDFTGENSKWGSSVNADSFDGKLQFLEGRIQWLDESYFNI